MPALSRPMGGRNPRTPWGSSKVQRTISVTDAAWELWTEAAMKAGVNRSEVFEVIARSIGGLDVLQLRTALLSDLALSHAKEIPLEHEESVVKEFGKWVRLTLASKGVDFVVEEHHRLVDAAACFKGLLSGKPVKGEELIRDLPVIAGELGFEEGECWDVIQKHIQNPVAK